MTRFSWRESWRGNCGMGPGLYWTPSLLPLSSDSCSGTSLLNSGPSNKSWSERFGPCEDGGSGFSTFIWDWDKTLCRSNRACSIDFTHCRRRFSTSSSSRASRKLKPRRFPFSNFISLGLIGSTKVVRTSAYLVRRFWNKLLNSWKAFAYSSRSIEI